MEQWGIGEILEQTFTGRSRLDETDLEQSTADGDSSMKNEHFDAAAPHAVEETGNDLESTRREFLAGLAGAAVVAGINPRAMAAQAAENPVNVARVAVPTSLAMASENKLSALNDGFMPENSFDRSHGLYALHNLWDNEGKIPWVQYEWSEPVSVNKVEIYWAVDRPRPAGAAGPSGRGWLPPPATDSFLEWKRLCTGQPARGLGVALDTFNATTFEPVKTSKLRVEVVTQKGRPAGILEWRVYNAGRYPSFSRWSTPEWIVPL